MDDAAGFELVAGERARGHRGHFQAQAEVGAKGLAHGHRGGLVGDLDEHAHEGVIETAQRELEEEAGYRAAKITYIMAGPSSAGMSNEVCAFVRATGLTRVSDGGGVHGEDIVVHHVPRREVAPWLASKMREGYSIDPKLYAGLYFLDRDLEGRPWAD